MPDYATDAKFASARNADANHERFAGTRRPAQPGDDGAFVPMHQSFVRVLESTLERPANVTGYSIGDLEGAAEGANYYAFDIGAHGLYSALIISARLVRNSTSSTTVRRRMMVHDGALVTAPAADNAAFPLLWANRLTRCGSILFASPTAVAEYGAGSDATEWDGVLSCDRGIAVSPVDGIVRVHSVLLDAFTPGSGVSSTLELGFVA